MNFGALRKRVQMQPVRGAESSEFFRGKCQICDRSSHELNDRVFEALSTIQEFRGSEKASRIRKPVPNNLPATLGDLI
jgi:hypothetical protein